MSWSRLARPTGLYRRPYAVTVQLSAADEAMLDGARGPAAALAMRIITGVAEAIDAPGLRDVAGAHIDGCLYNGQASLDFAERLVRLEAHVAVPTTLNVSSLDLLHPDLYRGEHREPATRLVEAYRSMGCEPTWTCAPYQLAVRPALGEHVAWAESNAIVFANSVLGARTERYGDFIDICAAVTGRVPDVGLHRDDNRLAGIVFGVEGVSDSLRTADVFFPVLGYLIGRRAGRLVPAIVGLEMASEDQLKALGAAAAASGSVGLFHAVGITPEAPDGGAVGISESMPRVEVTMSDLRSARDALSTRRDLPLGAVSLGTPHYSLSELRHLADLVGDCRVASGLAAYVSTSRAILAEAASTGVDTRLQEAGFTLLVDTCTYVTPIMERVEGVVMTDSAKWAYYAPGNLGVEVAFGSTEDVVASALAGRPIWDEGVWRD